MIISIDILMGVSDPKHILENDPAPLSSVLTELNACGFTHYCKNINSVSVKLTGCGSQQDCCANISFKFLCAEM